MSDPSRRSSAKAHPTTGCANTMEADPSGSSTMKPTKAKQRREIGFGVSIGRSQTRWYWQAYPRTSISTI